MNQILVTEKVIVTPDFKKKKRLYKFNFFLSSFLACTLFGCCVYAEYDRNRSEQVSKDILLGIYEEEVADNTTISVEEDVIIINALSDGEEDANSVVNISNLLSQAEKPKSTVVESVAPDRKILLYRSYFKNTKTRYRISCTLRYI